MFDEIQREIRMVLVFENEMSQSTNANTKPIRSRTIDRNNLPPKFVYYLILMNSIEILNHCIQD